MDINKLSNSEELFLIKHQADILINSPSHTFNKNDSMDDLFWGSNENWTKDPKTSIRFTKSEATAMVGKLLLEHGHISILVPLSSVWQTRPPAPPKSGFILICDCEGDPTDIYSNACDELLARQINKLNKQFPNHAPHSAWQQCVGGFTQLFPVMENE
jgi:hypothetical protein